MFILGLLLFCVTHLLFLESTPGFHFDEAWAAEHSLRIAFEPGFWPLKAMTVQTSSWSHYVTAAFFRIFSPSVFVFRASHVFLNVGALCLLALGLKNFSFPKVAKALPWVAALMPALVMNHRFSIEITAFHSLCFGLIFYSISKLKSSDSNVAWAGIVVGSFLGFTSHVFFLGVMAAFLWMLVSHKDKLLNQAKTRFVLALLVLSLLPFVYSISTEIIWKWKGRALLLLFVTLLVWLTLLKARLPKFTAKFEYLIYLVSIPFLFNFLLFCESHWLVLHHFGAIAVPYLVGAQFILLVALAIMYYRTEGKNLAELKTLLRFTLALLAAGGVVMITQAPRYYEILFWMLTILFSAVAVWAWEQGKKAKLLLYFWSVSAAFTLILNYYNPGYHYQGISKDFRFLALKESSYDYVPKTFEVNKLNLTNCWNELKIEDPRKRYTFSVLQKLQPKEYQNQSKKCLAPLR